MYKSQTLLSYLLLMMLLLGIIFFSKAHVLEASNIANHIPIVILLKTCVNCTYLESMLVILKSML